MNTSPTQPNKSSNTYLTRKRAHEEIVSSNFFEQSLNEDLRQIQNLKTNIQNTFFLNWDEKFIRDNQMILDHLNDQSLWFLFSTLYFSPLKHNQQFEDDFSSLLLSQYDFNENPIKKNSSRQLRHLHINDWTSLAKSSSQILFNEPKPSLKNLETKLTELFRILHEDNLKKIGKVSLFSYLEKKEKYGSAHLVKIDDELFCSRQQEINLLTDKYMGYNIPEFIKVKLSFIDLLKRSLKEENMKKKKKENIFNIKKEIETIRDEDDFVCFICNNGDIDSNQLIYECESCHVTVHQTCYGILTDSVENWRCDLCKQYTKEQAYETECLLCPVKGGAMKQIYLPNESNFVKNIKRGRKLASKALTLSEKDLPKYNSSIVIPKDDFEEIPKPWVHLSCALWNPNINFGNFEEKTEINNIDSLEYKCFFDRCDICNLVGKGPTIKCQHSECNFQCHPECARINHYYLEIENCKGMLNYSIYCFEHQQLHFLKILSKKKTLNSELIKDFSSYLSKLYKAYEKEYKKPLFDIKTDMHINIPISKYNNSPNKTEQNSNKPNRKRCVAGLNTAYSTSSNSNLSTHNQCKSKEKSVKRNLNHNINNNIQYDSYIQINDSFSGISKTNNDFIEQFRTHYEKYCEEVKKNKMLFKKEVNPDTNELSYTYIPIVENLSYQDLLNDEKFWKTFDYNNLSTTKKKNKFMKIIPNEGIFDEYFKIQKMEIITDGNGQEIKHAYTYDDTTIYCYCKRAYIESLVMVQCENKENCVGSTDGWYHIMCVPELKGKTEKDIHNTPFYCKPCQRQLNMK